MRQFSTLFLSFFLVLSANNSLRGQTPAPDFTITTTDGQVKKLYQDYIDQQKLVVIEAFFTSCPPCATHAPLFQSLYTSMQINYPGQVEFMLLSTLLSDSNVKVAQYKTTRGLTMPGAGNDGGSIAALQPYLNGLFGDFQGTPTFIVIAPGTGEVFFDLRGNSPSQTIALVQAKIEELLPKDCSIKDLSGSFLESVQMRVESPSFDTSFVVEGSYDLSEVASLQNNTYTLKPYKSGNVHGLTTYDLVLISKHILGLEPFLCPWQLVAADVNCTSSITTFDIVTARQVILGIRDSFPCGAWRFMPDSATLSNGACKDFVGVQLGDVNAIICEDGLVAEHADERAPMQKLYFQDKFLLPGETANLELFLGENIQLDGFQFSLNFTHKHLKMKEVYSSSLQNFDAESFHLHEQGLSVSWVQPNGQMLASNTPVLTLELLAPQGGRLSELLRWSADLAPEVYDSKGTIRPLQLTALPAESSFLVVPNPAKERFTLHVQAAQTGDYWVQIMDVRGQTVLTKSFATAMGSNRLDIEMPAQSAGLYFINLNGATSGKVLMHD
jgi:peroxiredoxin